MIPAPEARRHAPETDIPTSAYEDEPAARRPRSPLSVLREAEPLTKREARASRDTVVTAIQKYCELADEAIPLASKSGAPVQIWSTLDQNEAEILADCLLDLAQRWAVPAAVVRGIVRTYTWLEVGLITLPRFKQTIGYYLREGFALNFNMRLGR